MQERYKLEMELKNYPDVVTTKELMIMLDGICENTALSLLRQDKICLLYTSPSPRDCS